MLTEDKDKKYICNIAWFRLHEAASKNEHERAFLNYRLLMYSYNDTTYKKEIKAQLHYFFDEKENAKNLFVEVFYEYKNCKEYTKCLAIYTYLKENFPLIPIQKECIMGIINIHPGYKSLYTDMID
jgi:hypothetical protein